MGEVGTAIGLGGDIAGLVGGGKGGSSGSGGQFQSAGGITPQQEALAQYTYGQNLLKDASTFANTGTGQSTMATAAATGARFGKAEQEAQMSNTDQDAMYSAFQESQNFQNANMSELGQLASLANQQSSSANSAANTANETAGVNSVFTTGSST